MSELFKRVCTNGHAVMVDDNYCSECGEYLPKLPPAATAPISSKFQSKPNLFVTAISNYLLIVGILLAPAVVGGYIQKYFRLLEKDSNNVVLGLYLITFVVALRIKTFYLFVKRLSIFLIVIAALILLIAMVASVPPLVWEVALGVIIGLAVMGR